MLQFHLLLYRSDRGFPIRLNSHSLKLREQAIFLSLCFPIFSAAKIFQGLTSGSVFRNPPKPGSDHEGLAIEAGSPGFFGTPMLSKVKSQMFDYPNNPFGRNLEL